MTPEQRARLAEMVEKHPNMRVSALLVKIQREIMADRLRKETRQGVQDAGYPAGASEGLQ